jgi:dTDP-4-dehydrorhamnose reductase
VVKILVLGGAGMWGHQAFLKLSQHFGKSQVACTLRKPRSAYDKIGIFKEATVFDNVDFQDFDVAKKCLEIFKPHWILNCVGLTPRKYDTENKELYTLINSELPYRIADWAQENDAKLIHFSTDCVFSGKRGHYTEKDKPDAQDVYGKSKAAGEVQAPHVLTYRLSKIGRELEKKTELVEWFLSKKGTVVQGYSQAWYAGLTTNAMADELIRVIENFPELSGLYQVASAKISKYELLKLLNQVYSCGIEIQKNTDYALDKSLDCDLYSEATGFKCPDWLEMIKAMKNEERIDYDSLK